MGYGNWSTKNKDAIQATSAIFSTIGIAAVAVGLWVSIQSLKVASNEFEQSKKATLAEVSFNIQRFAFELAQDAFASPDFRPFIFGEDLSPKVREAQIKTFFTFLNSREVIFTQRELGYIGDPQWEVFKREICWFMRSKGADTYFDEYPIKDSIFDDDFKQMILDCRTSAGADTNAP